MEKFHYWSTWNISNIITVEVREVSLQGAGGSLWSSVPSQNLLWSMPSGCLALDKCFCSGSIQKDTIRSGIRTHIYVVPRGQQRDFLTVCSHADWCESRKTQWECSLEAFVQGVGEQTKLVLVLCAHETGLIWTVRGGKPKYEEKARHSAKHATDRFSSSPQDISPEKREVPAGVINYFSS